MSIVHASSTTHLDQIVKAFNHLGARFVSTFMNGSVHPRSSTYGFTLPLQNGIYIKVFCPLDHTSSDSTPFNQAVSRSALKSGDWLTWVVTVCAVLKMKIIGDELSIEEWPGSELRASIGSDVKVESYAVTEKESESGSSLSSINAYQCCTVRLIQPTFQKSMLSILRLTVKITK